ncbi:hypothetical protein YZ82_01595 [Campylobacter hyointestinalis]|uniref:Uncharacterized protein n=1 Tax=Campylobacter hyointestinalis TaxID=198 RepID=A0A562XKK8_CAMHY|nr:hypothetical protein [Campylobacter hyointestinalis]TWO22637.1 hypothetical protein YZ82_01595 [Campylobacter hyointestinalis]
MNKLIIKYIGVFFLFLILVLGCMGFIIYDKLMIEYEKHIKEVIMFGGVKDYIESEMERIKSSYSPNQMLKDLTMGAKGEDILQRKIDEVSLQNLEKVGTRQLDRIAELQEIVFNGKNFSSKVYDLMDTDKYKNRMNRKDIEDIAPDIGYALRRNMSDDEFLAYMGKEYTKATDDDIIIATEAYRDISSIFNQEMNSKLNDISLKNYDAIMKAYDGYKEYFGKDNEKFKKLKNPKDIFDSIKGSNGKERMYVSALLATLPTEDLMGMLKDQGTEGFNAIMNLLGSRPNNAVSFNTAISNANKVLGNMGSNIGSDIIKGVELYNNMGLEHLISMNPNIANLSVNDRVYRNIVDDKGNVIGREDTGLLRNNYNPVMFVELAKMLKGIQDKRALKNQDKNTTNLSLK